MNSIKLSSDIPKNNPPTPPRETIKSKLSLATIRSYLLVGTFTTSSCTRPGSFPSCSFIVFSPIKLISISKHDWIQLCSPLNRTFFVNPKMSALDIQMRPLKSQYLCLYSFGDVGNVQLHFSSSIWIRLVRKQLVKLYSKV
uniref:(northern house mosquito) hypothetical protein n=1 Tax=Culex pipiens TaxID=7175 RepID=A0A8D8FAC2_CULPI